MRRSPSDLPFQFADRGLAEALAVEREEPDWLRAERLAAWERFAAMPVEGNQLYTPYIDLRGAVLGDARPYVRTSSVPGPAPKRWIAATPDRGATTHGPDALEGAAGLIELSEDTVATLALGEEAAAAGVTLETFGAALARDPDGFRADIEGGSTLPTDDKLAMLARGFWSQGVRLVVPDGVTLERPFLIRWRL